MSKSNLLKDRREERIGGELWSEWCQGSQLPSAFPSTVLGFTFHLHSGPKLEDFAKGRRDLVGQASEKTRGGRPEGAGWGGGGRVRALGNRRCSLAILSSSPQNCKGQRASKREV